MVAPPWSLRGMRFQAAPVVAGLLLLLFLLFGGGIRRSGCFATSTAYPSSRVVFSSDPAALPSAAPRHLFIARTSRPSATGLQAGVSLGTGWTVGDVTVASSVGSVLLSVAAGALWYHLLRRRTSTSTQLAAEPAEEGHPCGGDPAPFETYFAGCTIRNWHPNDALPLTYLVKKVQRLDEHAFNLEGDEEDCEDAEQVYGAENGQLLVVERDGVLVGCGAFTVGTQVTQFNSGATEVRENVAALRRVCLAPEYAGDEELADLLPFLLTLLMNMALARGAREVIALGFLRSRCPTTQPTPAVLHALGLHAQQQFSAAGPVVFGRALNALVTPVPGGDEGDEADVVDVIAVDGTLLGRYPRHYALARQLLVRD
eukprot:EG_transcript_15297